MNAISPELHPIEVDPRSCEVCDLKIDDHHSIDDGDGPQHFCISELYEKIAAGKAGGAAVARPFFLGWNAGIDFALVHVAEEEISMIMETIMVEPEPATSIIPPRAPEPYRSAASTVAAFKYVVSLKDAPRLAAWLRNHPKDAPLLLELLEHKTNA
jgi:hypothetical protein